MSFNCGSIQNVLDHVTSFLGEQPDVEKFNRSTSLQEVTASAIENQLQKQVSFA